MFGIGTLKRLRKKLCGQGQEEHKKYCCPVCGVKSDEPQEIFHHISEVHVMGKPVEVLNVSNDCDDELQKTYVDLVRTYRTSDRIMMAIVGLRDISVSEKVLLGYVLGRNVSLQKGADNIATIPLEITRA